MAAGRGAGATRARIEVATPTHLQGSLGVGGAGEKPSERAAA
jgi:hypothetical protein